MLMQGVTRGWTVVDLPASGQIFNVSALVLPTPMPADDDRQVPLFGDDVLRDLLEITRRQAEVVQELTHINRELIQNARDARNGLLKHEPEPATRSYVPQIRALRRYDTGRAYFQQIERETRNDLKLKPDDQVTPQMLWEHGAPSPKTQERIITRTYHLPRDAWPPSTWPDAPPGLSSDLS